MTDTNKGKNYKLKECPYCHKFFGNVKNHILLKHQAELPGKGEDGAVELTKEDLLGKEEESQDQEEQNAEINYHCNDCGADVRRGETRCHSCGATLIWEGIE